MSSQAFSVRNFYGEKSVLITGGAGSIGKLVVLKLLKTCPNIGRIYLLIRPKKEKTTADRLFEMLNVPIFQDLRENCPSAISKVVAIEGNLCEEGLGLSEIDKATLIENVSVVLHCAATLRFDMTLEQALQDNVFGTRNLLDICCQISKIEAFVHVSTLYSTCHKPVIEERIPSIPVLEGKLDFTKSVEDFARAIPSNIVKDWPNTYTFSKAIAEIMINDYKDKFPISILRPSIILASLQEPMPGWIDNYYGITLTTINAGLGILRSAVYDGNIIGDLIPSDFVVNSLICVGCKTKQRETNEITVFNCCSGRRNPVYAQTWFDNIQEYNRKYPSMLAIRYPDMKIRKSLFSHGIISVLQHGLVSHVLDFIAACQSKKRRFVRIHQKLTRLLDLQQHFALNSWQVYDCNLEKLNDELREEERLIFYTDPKIINWHTCARTYVLGIREHLLKEDPKNINEAATRINRLYWTEKGLQLCVLIGSAAMLYHFTWDVPTSASLNTIIDLKHGFSIFWK